MRVTPSGASLRESIGNRVRAFTWAELVALSSERATRTAVARRDVVRLLHDTYVAREFAESFTARADAALLWAGHQAVLTGAAAAFLWRLIDQPPDVIEINVPRGRRLRAPAWIRIRSVSYDVPSVLTDDGRQVAQVGMGLIHAWESLSPDRRSTMLFAAVNRSLTTAEEIRELLDQMPRVRHRRPLVAQLAAIDAGAESFLEQHSLESVFVGVEFARLVRQHDVLYDGRRYRLDMYDPATRTAFELDSAAHHGSIGDRTRDVRRDADLAGLGIQTLRFTYRDLMQRPEWCRQKVREVLRVRTPRQ